MEGPVEYYLFWHPVMDDFTPALAAIHDVLWDITELER
jgi:hypothetical protein